MNPHAYSLIALLLSCFFAGSYLTGEMSRRREMREKLDELKQLQKETMSRVDSINVAYQRDKKGLIDETRLFYMTIDTLLQSKFANTQQMRRIEKKIEQQARDLEIEGRLLDEAIKSRRLDLNDGQ
jgi:hypothetical protein